jgi:lipopolysaccharide export LptBFGC system permease protein LptF
MGNEMNFSFFIYFTKKLVFYFGIVFLVVFLLFIIYNIISATEYLSGIQITYFSIFMLMLYSLPSFFVISSHFGVCIGFTYGLIKVNLSMKYLLPTIFLSIIITITMLYITNNIYPKSEEKINVLYSKIYIENNIHPEKGPSIKNLKERKDNKMLYNIYLIELGKKYSIACSVLFFAFFALCLSMVLHRHHKIALSLSVLSCFLYYIMLYISQNISLRIGKHGFLMMWFPNIIILIMSIILFFIAKCKEIAKHTLRHRAFKECRC